MSELRDDEGIRSRSGGRRDQVCGDNIPVRVEYLKCRACGETFDDPTLTSDPHANAYREIPKRHGMLQPEEIRISREQNGLTQGELGRLLGWGAITLSL